FAVLRPEELVEVALLVSDLGLRRVEARLGGRPLIVQRLAVRIERLELGREVSTHGLDALQERCCLERVLRGLQRGRRAGIVRADSIRRRWRWAVDRRSG